MLTVVIGIATLWSSTRSAKLAAVVIELDSSATYRDNFLQRSDKFTAHGMQVDLKNWGRAPSHNNFIEIAASDGSWFVAIAGSPALLVDAGDGSFKQIGVETRKLLGKPTMLRVRCPTLAPKMSVQIQVAWAHETDVAVERPVVAARSDECVASVSVAK